jgi:hypothetical protein
MESARIFSPEGSEESSEGDGGGHGPLTVTHLSPVDRPPRSAIAAAVCANLAAAGSALRVSRASPSSVSELVGGLTRLTAGQRRTGGGASTAREEAAYRSLAEGLLMMTGERQRIEGEGGARAVVSDPDPDLDPPLIRRMRPKALSRALKGFAEAGFRDLVLFDAAVTHATSTITGFGVGELLSLLWALVRWGGAREWYVMCI